MNAYLAIRNCHRPARSGNANRYGVEPVEDDVNGMLLWMSGEYEAQRILTAVFRT